MQFQCEQVFRVGCGAAEVPKAILESEWHPRVIPGQGSLERLAL